MLAEQKRKQASFFNGQPESVQTTWCSAGRIIIAVLYFGASKSGTTCVSGRLLASCDYGSLLLFLTGMQFVGYLSLPNRIQRVTKKSSG